MDNYILGGGITALIVAFYNPEYILITPEIGGFVKEISQTGLLYIQKNKDNEELLVDLGIKPIIAKIKIIHLRNNRLITFNKDEMLVMIKKKLTDIVTKEQLPIHNLVPILANTETEDLEIFEIEPVELLEKLRNVVIERNTFKIISQKVVAITKHCIQTEDGAKFFYKKIISTLPANIFWNIYSEESCKKQIFKALDITVVQSDTYDYDIKEPCIIYPIDEKFTKVTYKNGKYFFQFTGALTQKDLADFQYKVEDVKVYKNKIITNVYGNISPENIAFIGRYAKWLCDYRIENVIQDVKRKYILSEIFSEQKRYNSRYVNFDIDIKEQRKITADYIVRLISECGSLIDTFKDKPTIDYHKLLEEWIDIFKYWLSIGLIWNINQDTFLQELIKKNKKLNGEKKIYNMEGEKYETKTKSNFGKSYT